MNVDRLKLMFGTDFQSCRERFLESARVRGASVTAHMHPELHELGVATDTLLIGPQDAAHLRVVLSGAHGVELPFGSAVQCQWLREEQALADDTAVLLVHAVNCSGAYHKRRMTDANIDLCRNFGAEQYHPRNPGYEALADDLNAPVGDAGAEARLAAQQQAMGPHFISAVMGGQFADPRGFSFGGLRPCWSRRLLERCLKPFVATAQTVSALDLHTGVGPFGKPTFVCLQQGAALERARQYFGAELLAPAAETADGQQLHPAVGHPTEGFERLFPEAQVTFTVLELGTYPPAQTLPILIEEHRLTREDASAEVLSAVRERLWDLHAPTTPEWREAALQAGASAMAALLQ